MPTTLIADNELPLTWQDCLDYLDDDQRADFFRNLISQRIGQAWMNALTSEDYRKLTDTFYDPFYHDSKGDVIRALMFLLEN